jgi:serine/threonine-protein kinase
MGVVYRARDLQLDRPVAIKLVVDEGSSAAKERFLTEARRTANVRHPSIVEVFDVGEDNGDAFLVMELLEGETVGERLARTGRIEPAEAISIASEVCDALAAAHDAGLVHRDLKPGNLFLVKDGTASSGRRVKLLDFGIAKRIDGSTARTDPNMLVGTFEYMAPEQIRGKRIDGRTDLYSLGMTLCAMLTGKPAFAGENVAALIHQHVSVAPTSLRERAPEIPPWLDALVLRLLAKEPDARLASAADVKRALAGTPMEGAPTKRVALGSDGSRPASSPREGMRMLDDDGQAPETAPLELDLGDSVAGTHAPAPERAIARVPQRLPPVEIAPASPMAVAPSPLPAWLEPLANVPVAVSKRVLGYSLFVFALNIVFFRGSFLFSLMALTVAAAGGVSMWAGSRAQR